MKVNNFVLPLIIISVIIFRIVKIVLGDLQRRKTYFIINKGIFFKKDFIGK